MKKTIKVVAAVIRNDKNQILCALRSEKMSLPNLWEFPGGKIEPGEKPEETLVREIKEELDCEIIVGEFICQVVHEYPGFNIDLSSFEAEILSGEPEALEHSEIKWLEIGDLKKLEWASADIPTVEKLLI